MANWMDDTVLGKGDKSVRKKSSRTGKGAWALPLLGKHSTAVTVYKPHKSESAPAGVDYVDAQYREIKERNKPSKEYLRQIKLAKKQAKEQRIQEKREAKRNARIQKDLRSAEVHRASAIKFEQLARERRAKKTSRRRSYAGATAGIYNLINPYNKKIFRGKPKKRRSSGWF